MKDRSLEAGIRARSMGTESPPDVEPPVEPLVTKLATALVWKLDHPTQHSSLIDDALLDYLEQVGDDVPAKLVTAIQRAPIIAALSSRIPTTPTPPTGNPQGRLVG